MHQRDRQFSRVRAAFPRVAAAGDDILSLADYLDRRPERFFSRSAADHMANLLEGLLRDHPDLLVRFFSTQHDALKIAFRTLEEINRHPVQDRTLGDLGDELERLSTLDLVIHPAYLRLREAILGVAILPAAQLERRKRGADELKLSLINRIDELEKTPMGPLLQPFDRHIRNAIAHGRVVFRDGDVEYRDFKQTVTHGVAGAFRLFDQALDVCNGFMMAYRQFFILTAKFFASEKLTVPLPVVIRELQAQVETPSWRILGAVEAMYAADVSGLRLLVDTTLENNRDIYESTAVTGLVAERLAPGFDTYDIQLRASGMPKGVGVAKAERLREARRRGVTAPLDVGAVFETILVFDKITEQASDLLPATFTPGQPILRRTRLVRKADWLQLNAIWILEMDDRDAAMSYVRVHVHDLIAAAAEAARATLEDDELRTLPIGATYLMVFLRDVRQRELSGIGTNTFCQIIERSVGPIKDWPLHQSVVEHVGRIRIEWNTAPFGDE